MLVMRPCGMDARDGAGEDGGTDGEADDAGEELEVETGRSTRP